MHYNQEVKELTETLNKQLAWIRGAISQEPKYLEMLENLKLTQLKLNKLIDEEIDSSKMILNLYTWHMTKDVVQYFVIIYLLIYLYIKYNNIYISISI